MKQLLVALLLFTGIDAYAQNAGTLRSVIRDSSVTDIPISFTDADGLFFSDLNHKTNIQAINLSAIDVEICLNAKAASGCSSTDLFFVPAGGTAGTDAMVIGELVIVRSRGIAITSGVIDVKVW